MKKFRPERRIARTFLGSNINERIERKMIMKRLLVVLLILMLILSAITVSAVAEESDTIEFFYTPWASTPFSGEDPYEAYLEEKYGYDFVLTPATDFSSQLMTRATAGDMPDLILIDMTDLRSLYDQGVLLEDWTPYLENMPNTCANMSDLAKAYLTLDGKIIACPAIAGDQKWSFMIRQDWLDNLGLSMPTSDEELLNVMRAFTFDDPDGNGVDDTYGFTAAGGNKGTGELANLLLLYASEGYFVDENGQVTSAIHDGSYLQYLKLARIIVEEGLIDPDWYTQGWDERKPNLYAGKFGICWYPASALIQELSTLVGNDESVYSMWKILPMYTGALPSQPVTGVLRTVSADAAADEKKMAVICQFLEDCAYPNEQYFMMRDGYEIDACDVLEEVSEGVYFVGYSSEEQVAKRIRQPGSSLLGWGQMVQAPGQNYFQGYLQNLTEPSQMNMKQAEFWKEWDAMKHYDAAYRLLNPDPTLLEDANAMKAEFEIAYLLGEVDEADYEEFVQEYNANYGDQLLKNAEETFRAYGVIE